MHRSPLQMERLKASGDHDVGCRRRGDSILARLPGAGPTALGLAAQDLEEAAEREQDSTQDEPGPAEHDVPVPLEEVEADREEGEHPGSTDDDTAEEDPRDSPLAL